MRKAFRIAIVLAGVIVLLIAGYLVYLALCATDIITFTKRTQSIQLPQGRVLDIYRTTTWEYYDCKFELLEARTGRLLIPRTHFDSTMYWGFKSATTESTPEHRTTYVPLTGGKSGVVGVVSSEDPECVLLLVDLASSKYVAANGASGFGLQEEEKALAEKLLLALKGDYPMRDLAFPGTRGAALLHRQHDVERFRQTFARMDATVQVGTTFSNALEVSWPPITMSTNSNGTIEAEFRDQPVPTWLGPIDDKVLTNGFTLLVSNGIIIHKTYSYTSSY